MIKGLVYPNLFFIFVRHRHIRTKTIKMNISHIIELIVESLSNDLLKPKYRVGKKNKYWGHCYVATETLYYLIDDDERANYKPQRLKVDGDTHWYLVNTTTNEIIDITKDQFDFDLPYEDSINCFFLTKTPSKRSLILINRIYEKISD